MATVEAPLVFPVAAFYLAVMPWGIGANVLSPDAQQIGCLLKGGHIGGLVGIQAVGKLKAIVGLDAVDLDSFSRPCFDQRK